MVFALLATTLCLGASAPAPAVAWRPLRPGVSYAALRLVRQPSFGDGLLHVIRVEPGRASVAAYASSEESVPPLTAAEWAHRKQLAVVINAGMYGPDHRTHTGYFRLGPHTLAPRWVAEYKSVLLLPGSSQQPRACLVDFAPADRSRYDRSGTVLQNLRLIEFPGHNVWAENGREWSEAAIASTRTGELLFLFSRTPLSMHRFNDLLLGLGLEIERAAHLEGGPEASLSIHAGGVDLDLSGSYETGFVLDDDNRSQWPLPNVLGVGNPVN